MSIKKKWMISIFIVVVVIILMIILFAPINWTGNKEFPYEYKLIDHIALVHQKKNKSSHESILFDFDTVAKKYGLPYCLSEGTALGVYRGGSLIKGDSDVDVCVKEEYVAILKKVTDEMLKKYRFKVMRNKPLSLTRDKHYIDIDIMGMGRPCMNGVWPNKCDHIISHFTESKLVLKQYDGTDKWFLCPPESYYIYMYGDDWKTPKKGFKHAHNKKGKKNV